MSLRACVCLHVYLCVCVCVATHQSFWPPCLKALSVPSLFILKRQLNKWITKVKLIHKFHEVEITQIFSLWPSSADPCLTYIKLHIWLFFEPSRLMIGCPLLCLNQNTVEAETVLFIVNGLSWTLLEYLGYFDACSRISIYEVNALIIKKSKTCFSLKLKISAK